MKKIIFLIIILSLLFGTVSFAQETGLPDPGLTPDSPFYFFDTLGEKIGMFFTFGAERKAEKALKYADEKLAEVKVMAEENKVEAIERAKENYQEFLGLANTRTQEAKGKGRNVEELATLITEKTLKHQEILVEVFEKVPEAVKSGLERAIEVSKKGFEEAVQAVSGAKQEELQQKAEEIKLKIEEKLKGLKETRVIEEEKPVEMPEEEVKPKMLDTDGDFVPDNEDDYPLDSGYDAKLEVTKINWYISKDWPAEGAPIVVLEYQNNKPYHVMYGMPFATIKKADGTIIKTDSAMYGQISGYLFKPEEKCYALFPRFEKGLVAEIASVEGEIKAKSGRGLEKKLEKAFEAAGFVLPKELNSKVESHHGFLEGNRYYIEGVVRNRGDKTENIRIYAGFFSADGTLLDVEWNSQPYGIITISPGEEIKFNIGGTHTPEADKIATHNLCITR